MCMHYVYSDDKSLAHTFVSDLLAGLYEYLHFYQFCFSFIIDFSRSYQRAVCDNYWRSFGRTIVGRADSFTRRDPHAVRRKAFLIIRQVAALRRTALTLSSIASISDVGL